MRLSIVIPVYNEKNNIIEVLRRVDAVGLPLEKEVIIVDDGSTDGTRDILKSISQPKYRVIMKNRNEGKGSALKEGFLEATGDIIIIQDADLEYDPNDYIKVIQPIIDGKADAVYGSRFVTSEPRRVLYYWHYLGNRTLTFFSNVLTNFNLSDMETCYKAFNKNTLDSFKHKLRSKKFGIEPEITARIAKAKCRVCEVGISYHGRTYEEGKKIGWKDGVAAVGHIIRFNIFSK
ncbi:glycosyltransferase family 2 protein [Patescibacteria group bacterium]